MPSTANPPSGAAGNGPVTAWEEAPLPEERQRLFEILTGPATSLYAVLDAARDLAALNWSKESGEEYQSLYDGESARNLEMFAPYLVRFSRPSPLLRKLIAKSWGRSWGIYLTSAASFPDLRKHFRHFLMAETEGARTVYFRFYDPRVLRLYLHTCNPQEVRQFFGPIESLFVEDEDPIRLLWFRVGARGLELEDVSLERGDASNP